MLAAVFELPDLHKRMRWRGLCFENTSPAGICAAPDGEPGSIQHIMKVLAEVISTPADFGGVGAHEVAGDRSNSKSL